MATALFPASTSARDDSFDGERIDIEGDVTPFSIVAAGARGAGRGLSATAPAAIGAAPKPARRGGLRFRQRKSNQMSRLGKAIPRGGDPHNEPGGSVDVEFCSEAICVTDGKLGRASPLFCASPEHERGSPRADQAPQRRRVPRSWSAPNSPTAVSAIRSGYRLSAEQGRVVVKNTFIHVADSLLEDYLFVGMTSSYYSSATMELELPWRPALCSGREEDVRLRPPRMPTPLGESSADSDASTENRLSESGPSTDWEFPVYTVVPVAAFFPAAVALAVHIDVGAAVTDPLTSPLASVGPGNDVGDVDGAQDDSNFTKSEATSKALTSGLAGGRDSYCCKKPPWPAVAHGVLSHLGASLPSSAQRDSLDVLDAFDAFHGFEWRESAPADKAAEGHKAEAEERPVASPRLKPDRAPEQMELASGQLVRLKALKRRPEFNGKCGVVERYDAAADRYSVRLLGCQGAEMRARLKREHFEVEEEGASRDTARSAAFVSASPPPAPLLLSQTAAAKTAATKPSRRTAAAAVQRSPRPAAPPAAGHKTPPAASLLEAPASLGEKAASAYAALALGAPVGVSGGSSTPAGWRPTLRA